MDKPFYLYQSDIYEMEQKSENVIIIKTNNGADILLTTELNSDGKPVFKFEDMKEENE